MAGVAGLGQSIVNCVGKQNVNESGVDLAIGNHLTQVGLGLGNADVNHVRHGQSVCVGQSGGGNGHELVQIGHLGIQTVEHVVVTQNGHGCVGIDLVDLQHSGVVLLHEGDVAVQVGLNSQGHSLTCGGQIHNELSILTQSGELRADGGEIQRIGSGLGQIHLSDQLIDDGVDHTHLVGEILTQQSSPIQLNDLMVNGIQSLVNEVNQLLGVDIGIGVLSQSGLNVSDQIVLHGGVDVIGHVSHQLINGKVVDLGEIEADGDEVSLGDLGVIDVTPGLNAQLILAQLQSLGQQLGVVGVTGQSYVVGILGHDVLAVHRGLCVLDQSIVHGLQLLLGGAFGADGDEVIQLGMHIVGVQTNVVSKADSQVKGSSGRILQVIQDNSQHLTHHGLSLTDQILTVGNTGVTNDAVSIEHGQHGLHEQELHGEIRVAEGGGGVIKEGSGERLQSGLQSQDVCLHGSGIGGGILSQLVQVAELLLVGLDLGNGVVNVLHGQHVGHDVLTVILQHGGENNGGIVQLTGGSGGINGQLQNSGLTVCVNDGQSLIGGLVQESGNGSDQLGMNVLNHDLSLGNEGLVCLLEGDVGLHGGYVSLSHDGLQQVTEGDEGGLQLVNVRSHVKAQLVGNGTDGGQVSLHVISVVQHGSPNGTNLGKVTGQEVGVHCVQGGDGVLDLILQLQLENHVLAHVLKLLGNLEICGQTEILGVEITVQEILGSEALGQREVGEIKVLNINAEILGIQLSGQVVGKIGIQGSLGILQLFNSIEDSAADAIDQAILQSLGIGGGIALLGGGLQSLCGLCQNGTLVLTDLLHGDSADHRNAHTKHQHGSQEHGKYFHGNFLRIHFKSFPRSTTSQN